MKIEKQAPFWWQYLSAPEIVERAKKCDIAILPLGSIEQHGPHLPTGHDTIQLFTMLERVAERTGAMLLPCPWYGAHPFHHHYYPGTVPLQNDTMRALIKDIIRGVALAGYNKFIMFYGHGQIFVADYAVHDLGLEGYFVVSVMFQDLIQDEHFDIMETPFWHADESETSIGLALFPELVDMSKATKGTATTMVDSEWVKWINERPGAPLSKICRWHSLTLCVPEYKDKVFNGVVGDATLATAEKGRKYIEVVVDRMVKFVNYIKERYPAGVKPPVK